jgi:hypothetical protein
MTGDNIQAVSAGNRMECICGSCLSYNECMRADEGILFCISGKTGNGMFGMAGCSCKVCPVRKARNLKRSYYCLRGSEQEQE